MTLNARQIAFRELPPERLSHIQYLSAPVGSGKTAAVIADIRSPYAEHVRATENHLFYRHKPCDGPLPLFKEPIETHWSFCGPKNQYQLYMREAKKARESKTPRFP